METFSPLFIISVFLLGATCGALLSTLQRQAQMERFKAEFAEQLCETSRQDRPEPVRILNGLSRPQTSDRITAVEVFEDLPDEHGPEWLWPLAHSTGNEEHYRRV